MKTYILLLLILVISKPLFAQSYEEEVQSIRDTFISTVKQLDSISKEIQLKYKDNKDFLISFEKSQKAWELYRDAQLNMKHDVENTVHIPTDVRNYCIPTYLTTLTQQRIEQLLEWLEGTIEGDICCGTVFLKD